MDEQNNLPWPVNQLGNCLVATHWPPDIDGMATAAGWCALARELQLEVRIAFYCPEPPVERFAWLTAEMTIEEGGSLDDYDICLLLDCDAVAELTRLPAEWLMHLEDRKLLFSVDHHVGSTVPCGDRARHLCRDAPCTACIFIDQGLFHPLFFASVWSDTQRLTTRVRDGVRYLEKMFTMGLDEDEATRQLELMEPRRPVVLFRDLVEHTRIVAEWRQESVGTVMVVTSSLPWRHSDTINEVREVLKHYADVLLAVDLERERVSLWGRPGRNLRLGDFARETLGGGGHDHMAGGPLKNRRPEELAHDLSTYLQRFSREKGQGTCDY